MNTELQVLFVHMNYIGETVYEVTVYVKKLKGVWQVRHAKVLAK